MTVRTQNIDILSAVAGKQAPAGGGLTRTAAADGGTPFVDLMAALGAQSESLAGAVTQTDLLERLPAGPDGGEARAAVGVDPLQLLARRPHVARAVPAHEGLVHDQVNGQTEGGVDLLLRPDELLTAASDSVAVVDEEQAVDKLAPEEARAAPELPRVETADASAAMDVRDLSRAVAAQVAGAERAAAVDARAAVRGHELPTAPAGGGIVAADAHVPAELANYLKAGARRVEAESGRESNRAPDASHAFADAFLRSSQENPAPTVTTAKEARPASLASLQVQQPFGGEQWGAAMNAQVLTMMRDGVAQARVQINPQNLGPVGIDLSMRDGVVNVSFDSPYTEVREALRDGVKGLERSLSEGGVQLGRVEVRDSLDFMAQGRSQREPQQDASGGQRQQQEWRQGRRDEADFASHLQLTGEDNAHS